MLARRRSLNPNVYRPNEMELSNEVVISRRLLDPSGIRGHAKGLGFTVVLACAAIKKITMGVLNVFQEGALCSPGGGFQEDYGGHDQSRY